MNSKKWTNTRLFWCHNETVVKIGLVNSSKVFRLEVNLKNTDNKEKFNLGRGQSLFTKEGWLIKKVSNNVIIDGKLKMDGELEEDFDLENYKPEEFYGRWYELKDLKSHTYEDGSELHTYYVTRYNQDLIRLFQYSVPKDSLGDIDCSYFRGDKEDKILELSRVIINEDDIVIRGEKTKAL